MRSFRSSGLLDTILNGVEKAGIGKSEFIREAIVNHAINFEDAEIKKIASFYKSLEDARKINHYLFTSKNFIKRIFDFAGCDFVLHDKAVIEKGTLLVNMALDTLSKIPDDDVKKLLEKDIEFFKSLKNKRHLEEFLRKKSVAYKNLRYLEDRRK